MSKGHTLSDDIREMLPGFDMRAIFDVGANTGQSVRIYRRHWRLATVFSFEPVAATFEQLSLRHADDPAVRCFRVALSDHRGTGRMHAAGTATSNRLIADDVDSPNAEDVPMTTGDLFCAEHQVDRISFMKIDTEGYDLAVLKGFSRMLAAQQIDLIQVEVGMHPGNRKHVPFEEVKALLESYGYSLFRIYDQVMERRGQPQLRRCNPVFISRQLVRAHRTPPTAKP